MNTTTKVTELPAPQYPMLTRMISKGIFRDEKVYRANVTKLVGQLLAANPGATREQIASSTIDIAVRALRDSIEPMVWVVGKPHPLVPECNVIRMFKLGGGGVEVYAAPADGTAGMRNEVPKPLLTEEAMPLDIFVEELTASELGDGDEDDSDEPEEPETTPVQTNGQQPPVS